MPHERRDTLRVPDSRLITEIAKERPSAASIINVSNTGIYTVKQNTTMSPRKGLIQLEIPLPEASESIWAVGQVMFERRGLSCTGSGIRFVTMANCHRSLIRDLVEYRKRDIYSIIQTQMEQNKNLASHPFQFNSRPGPLTEDTVRMYLMPGS